MEKDRTQKGMSQSGITGSITPELRERWLRLLENPGGAAGPFAKYCGTQNLPRVIEQLEAHVTQAIQSPNHTPEPIVLQGEVGSVTVSTHTKAGSNR